MRATIKIIAERAGVSIGTVDRVLHDRPYVKEEVRRRVLEVMEERGLIDLNRRTDRIQITLRRVEHKVDLEASSILKKLRDAIREN